MKTARTIILAALMACRLFAGETAKVAANATADFGDYTYDGAGNITGAGADRYTYDQYGRIKAATLTQGSTTITQSFGYDRYGNLLSIATTGDPTLVPAVDPLTNRIDKLTATTNALGSYDANGNLTSNNSSSSFAYDPLDVMSESTVGGQRRVYLYTAGNERIAVLKVTATGALTGSTWTLRDASAKVLRKLSKDGAGTWSWDEDYIYRGTQLLAAEVPGNTLQFHLDHLGTPRVITGNGGARLSSHTYLPFGREVAAFSTPDAEVMKFTGHERDDVNLDYMHARYYVPFAGRFLSVDPGRDWDLREPQSWNMYAYVRNNPVNNTDPDGKWCFPCLAPLVPIAVRAAPAVGRAGQRAYVYLSNPANVQRLINTGHSFVAVGVTLMESATKPGSADGDTAGKRMPKSVQEQVADEARDESGQTHCQYCGVATSEPGAEPAEGEIKGNTDHIIPASQGGNATADNAQHTCETCNKSAGANPKPKKTGARKLHEKEPGPQ